MPPELGIEVKRVGHGGASALARANTLASFDAAVAIGVDMIEFDVRAAGERLVLAHTKLHQHARCLTLTAALEHLSGPRFGDVELNLDLKHPGGEAAALEALRRFGLLHRALVSSQRVEVLDRVRALEPSARTGISIGGPLARRSRGWRAWRAGVLHALAQRRFGALMAQHRLIDGGLVEDVRARGAELYAWTAHDRPTIERLGALGVTGVATDDPHLFRPVLAEAG